MSSYPVFDGNGVQWFFTGREFVPWYIHLAHGYAHLGNGLKNWPASSRGWRAR